MECFISEEGVERKAGLEDILPLIDEKVIQSILRDAYKSIYLPYVLVHMPEEIKNMVYRNLSLRICGSFEKEVKHMESMYKEDSGYFENERARLISFIGENKFWLEKRHWLHECSDRLIWKETKPKEKTTKKEPPNPVEEAVKRIEDACNSGNLYLSTHGVSKDDMQSAFAAFQDRKNELQKIRSLTIYAEILPATALLFEAGGIEELGLNGEFSGTWPDFLEKCHTVTSISLGVWKGLSEFPLWIRNAVSLRRLYINGSDITLIPDWVCDMQSLTELDISSNNKNLKTLPDSIGNLKNLTKLSIHYSDIEKLPESIGDLISLRELILNDNKKLTSLPGSIGNLKDLEKFELSCSPIKLLPDCIYNLEKLTELSLENNKNMEWLPDSIGKLKNLATLNLRGSAIKKLPDALAHCSSLDCIDVRDTNINSFPDFISSIKSLEQSNEVLPEKRSISYSSYCDYYYTLVETILRFSDKAIREGILALEEDLEDISHSFFKEGIRLVVYGTDKTIIRELLTLKIEREHNYYIKKLKEIALEGILCIQNGDSAPQIGTRLASMVDIKNNLLATASAKYLAGDFEAFDNIDFLAALQYEEEREEIRFIKRAMKISEISRREGWLELDKHLDNERISARDVFEYGLPMVIDNWNYADIDKNLSLLIAGETDPVCKNLALAKKHAIKMIYEGYNPRIVLSILLAYFDDDITDSDPDLIVEW
jgi:flagellar motor component MotA